MNWYRVHELVTRLAAVFCRHPEGTICPHRQYEYDHSLRGYDHGFFSGRSNMEAKWRGNLTGEGPYADYPAPNTRKVTV